ncbi:MAG: crossover junction endodeoxyribonuclease RuvC [Patescibacteria group bacterium]
MKTSIIGIDGGFSSVGWAVLELTATTETETLVNMGVIRTAKSDKKLNVLSSSDSFRRCQEIAVVLGKVLDLYSPRVVAIESLSLPRNAGVSAKIGMGYGVLAALLSARSLPMAQVSPQGVKKTLAGSQSASKACVQEALAKRFGSPFQKRLEEFNKTVREHPADALAVAVAALTSEVVKLARSMAA